MGGSRRSGLALAMVGGVMMSLAALSAQDWPQWRGPNRDGAIAALREPAAWPATLTRRWQIEVGSGYATPLLVGERVYAFSRQGEDEVLTAFDATTARVIWRTAHRASFTMNPATRAHGPGPKSTPAFAGNRIFTLGMTGVVSAFDATTGRTLWRTDPPAVEQEYHTAMSPMVVDDVVIVHVGGRGQGALTAFDVSTGRPRWRWDGDGPAYGSPIVATLAGTRQVITFTQENLVGVALDTGALLWRRPYTTPATTTAQTPLIHDDMVIESGRANGITAFRPTRSDSAWTTPNVWHTDEVSVHMSDIVAVDGVAYGLSHLNRGQYFALDLDTGEVLWKGDPRRAEHAAMARAGRTLFSLEDDGELVVMRASRRGFEPVASYVVATSATWAQPAISGTRVFVKDVSTLALWTID